MALIGRALLILGLVVALYGIGASIYGARTPAPRVGRLRPAVGVRAGGAWPRWRSRSSRIAFYRNDFSFNVVAEHSSTTTPTFYKLAAAWSSQEGSLLLWVFLLSLWSSLILFLVRNRAREITRLRDRRAARLHGLLHLAGGVLGKPVRDQFHPRRPRAPGSTRCCCTRA